MIYASTQAVHLAAACRIAEIERKLMDTTTFDPFYAWAAAIYGPAAYDVDDCDIDDHLDHELTADLESEGEEEDYLPST